MDKTKIETKIYYGELLSIYGDFLTKKQYDYMQLYFQEDYSLGEIAENYQVSRVAIHNQIQSACQKMELFEEKLQMYYVYETFLPTIDKALETNDINAVATAVNLLKTKKDWREN